jgi:hypothetical protein
MLIFIEENLDFLELSKKVEDNIEKKIENDD